MGTLSTEFCGIALPNCFANASGPHCVTAEELRALARSNAALVVSKSCTLLPRAGNPEPRYFDTPFGSINSMGLPNLGYQFYSAMAAEIAKQKPYLVSVSGMTPEDNVTIITHIAANVHVHAIELNLSCPNLVGKPQVGYDIEASDRLIAAALKAANGKPLGIKLPPYFDFIHFAQMAEVLNRYPLAFITCVNSIGNGLVIDPETETVVIKPKGGFGGIGGDYIKPTALANVRKFRELLNPSIAVVGCGGVKNGTDAFEFLLAGAQMVQIGTQLYREGPGVFTRISHELEQVMLRKGYQSLDEFRGKLKVME